MLLKREFIYTNYEDEDGKYEDKFGWLDISNPHFQATNNYGVLHDFLDHDANENSGVEAELIAIGMSYANRLRDYNSGFQNKLEVMANEIDSVYRYYDENNFKYLKYPISYYCRRNVIKEELKEIAFKSHVSICINNSIDSLEESEQEEDKKRISKFCLEAIKYIAIGYNKAQKRYTWRGLDIIGSSVYNNMLRDLKEIKSPDIDSILKIKLEVTKDRSCFDWNIKYLDCNKELLKNIEGHCYY